MTLSSVLVVCAFLYVIWLCAWVILRLGNRRAVQRRWEERWPGDSGR